MLWSGLYGVLIAKPEKAFSWSLCVYHSKGLREPAYTLHSPQQHSCLIPWRWCFPGAGLQPQSEAPWSGPLLLCQSHPWHAEEEKGKRGGGREGHMLNQGYSLGLLTSVSLCPQITPVVVSLVNNNRRWLPEKENKGGWTGRDRNVRRKLCEPLVWDSGACSSAEDVTASSKEGT